jgi:hypothetical protein
MIIWKNNYSVSEEIELELKNFIKQEKFFDPEDELYTTFFDEEKPAILGDYYDPIVNNMMSDLGIAHRTRYICKPWIQLYNSKTKGHERHDHFSGSEFISWVHFLKVPTQKCFYFMDSYGNKIYPEYQSSGDFICFPSWAFHGVDKVEEDNFDRIIVSGNIIIKYYESVYVGLESNIVNNATLWVKIKDLLGR